MASTAPSLHPDAADASRPRYRSGAVAHMTGIAVSTLRIWERRYRVAAPPQTPSGHRLYSAHDVERLSLLKQLVDRGHAISTVAKLDLDRLHEVAATHAQARAIAAPRAERSLTALVIGFALARRLRDGPLAAVAREAGLVVIAERADLADAEARLDDGPPRVDVVLVHAATLQPPTASSIVAMVTRLGCAQAVVIYGFAPGRAVETLRNAGVHVRRDPIANADLAQLLGESVRTASQQEPRVSATDPVPPRRFDEMALTQVANASSTMACECPRHLAELVMQLAHFETYSAECANRGPDDAALHAYLYRVSAQARAQFEAALERVALAEGLELPA